MAVAGAAAIATAVAAGATIAPTECGSLSSAAHRHQDNDTVHILPPYSVNHAQVQGHTHGAILNELLHEVGVRLDMSG